MPRFRCPYCGEVLEADTKERLLEAVVAHAKEHHGMEVPPEEREKLASRFEE